MRRLEADEMGQKFRGKVQLFLKFAEAEVQGGRRQRPEERITCRVGLSISPGLRADGCPTLKE